ncbi:MAG: TRAP transporter large permease subunit, partial [Caldilineaceae bacterium]|nr:TRAP transporter large permease subunit [Caldilineaceae bacterium]
VTAAYIFLAVTLAPALVKAGVAPLPAHMFILYWGMLSYITPPVAIGAYAAATISGSNPMRTGFVSMRLGSIIYIIPFLFVLSPSLLLQSAFWPSVLEISTAILGVVLIASALQGYLVFVGSLIESNWAQWPARILLVLSGLLLAVPRLNVGLVSEAGGGQFFLIGLSAVLLLLTIGIAQWGRRRATQRQRA